MCKICGTMEDVVKQLNHCKNCLKAILSNDNDAHEKHRPLSRKQPVDYTIVARESPPPPKKPKPDFLSGLELVGSLPNATGTQPMVVRLVMVDYKLSQHAKPHQTDGVQFLWRNSFSDCNFFLQGDESSIR
jgi:hypothetical protein